MRVSCVCLFWRIAFHSDFQLLRRLAKTITVFLFALSIRYRANQHWGRSTTFTQSLAIGKHNYTNGKFQPARNLDRFTKSPSTGFTQFGRYLSFSRTKFGNSCLQTLNCKLLPLNAQPRRRTKSQLHQCSRAKPTQNLGLWVSGLGFGVDGLGSPKCPHCH